MMKPETMARLNAWIDSNIVHQCTFGHGPTSGQRYMCKLTRYHEPCGYGQGPDFDVAINAALDDAMKEADR